MGSLAKTFPGGIHPHEFGQGKSATNGQPSRSAQPPQRVAISMAQHIGAPCNPLVKPGQRVLMGQKIGEPRGFMGASVHSSVSGTVKALETRFMAGGGSAQVVVIENDFQDEWDPDIVPCQDPDSMSREELTAYVREKGIVGLGGAAFPTSIKLATPPDKPIDYVIVNGAECEPFLTSDHRMMLENPEGVVDGLNWAMKISGARTGIIAVEQNKPDAIAALEQAVTGTPYTVQPLMVKYPQGGEKQLIQAVTGRQVPSGKLPMDAGCIVMNVSTAAALSNAFKTGRPITERIVTITGDIPQPANLTARIGTAIGELIDQCGGLPADTLKVIAGGPMMGLALSSMATPVVKATGGVLIINRAHGKVAPESNCIRCGRCVEACPIHLMPLRLNELILHDRFDQAEAANALDCIECGSCSYVCPAKRELALSIRMGKREILKRRKAR